MIRFPLFGIPVEIQPFFWITTALLGGALDARTPESTLGVALFIAAAFVSVLVHELGHALTGLKLGGGQARIVLTAFGGLAFNQGSYLRRDQQFRVVAAGPGAGLALFLVVVASLCLPFQVGDVVEFTKWVLFGFSNGFRTSEWLRFIDQSPYLSLFIIHMLWINFWWSLLNFLPVMPLDGGQIAALYVSPRRNVHMLGMIAAGATAVIALMYLDQFYMAALFGYLAWRNYQNMREEPHWR